MSVELEQRGSSLIFVWGPPWQWWPKFRRAQTQHYPGAWALVWLWWGLWYVPRPAAAMLADAALGAALEKDRAGRRYFYLPHDFDEHDPVINVACRRCARTWDTEEQPHADR